MSFEIRKAERRKKPGRIAFTGPSGAGKTYSAIHFARGLVGADGEVVVVDTENGSAEMYSDKAGGFQVIPFGPPYSPKRYMEACDYVEAQWDERKVPVEKRALVIDQISHAWAGEGGLLEYIDAQRTNSGQKEGFAAWKKGTPIQQAFLERLLRVRAHLIVNIRSKVVWVIEKDERGKSAPRKIGLAPVQRADIEYEWDVSFDLEQDSNQARASKDRTSLYSGRVFQPSEAEGAKFAEFLAAGKPLAPNEEVAPLPKGDEVISPEQLTTLSTAAKVAGRQKEESLNIIELVCGHRVPAKITAKQYPDVLEKLSAPKTTSALDALAAAQ